MILSLAGLNQAAQPASLPWWFWIVLSLALVLMVWWLWRQGYLASTSLSQHEPEVHRAPVMAGVSEMPEVETVPAVVAVDDLKIIEGIGPRINTLLHQAGILTFAQLAEADPDHLQQILLDAGLRLAAPDMWPEQAALARDGKLDELKALQEALTGGRK